MRRFLRRLLPLAAVLTPALLLWGGYYVCNHGFSRHWRVRVSDEFRRRGVDLYVHRLTLDPVQGFVAREVRIFDAVDPDRILATIDRVALDINLTNLLHGKPFLDAADLRNANLSLPLSADLSARERLRVSHLNARIMFPPHEWYISQAEATVYGVQVSARGRLQNPEAFHSGEDQSKKPDTGQPELVLRIARTLEALRFGAGPPRLEVNFGGDLAEPRTLFADATLWGQRIGKAGYELASLYAALSLRDRVLEVKQCNLSNAGGELDASGSYDTAGNRAALQLRSTLDPVGLARMLGLDNPLAGWKFLAPPLIEFSARGTLGTPWQGLVTGHAALGRFRARGSEFQRAAADFSWDGARWYLRNGTLANRTGAVRLQALSLPNDFRARLDSTLNPNSLAALLPGSASQALHEWVFQQSPRINLSVTGTSATPEACAAEGQVSLGRTSIRGVPLNSASAQVAAQGQTLSCRNFTITRDEGAATGSFSYDFGKHEAWLTGIHAHLNTAEAAVWIDPDLARQLAQYRFKTAPNVTLNGFVQCANDKGTHLDVLVDAPGGMDYTFCRHVLSFPKIAGRLAFTEHRLQLMDVAATLCGGAMRGSADISLAHGAPGYTAQLQVDQADFASIAKLYFNYTSSHGLLSGSFDFAGKNDDSRTLSGTGQVSVSQGNVFAIPVLGPFSGILNSLVPGMGYNVAHDASCDFEVRGGSISTRDFVVKGKGFSMIGDGRFAFLDDRLDFRIRLNAQGLPGVLLFPVSKLLEYASEGTLSNPNWKPVLLTRREAPKAP